MSFVIAIAIFFIVLVFSAINVLNEYERVVVFTLGRFTGIKGPGLVLIWPGIQRTRRVDLRVIVLNVPKQARQGHHPGGKRLRCHQPGGADDAALGRRSARDG
jgi:regulator of protease activity HflC (stomatin/prohibitin superfamily)